MTATFYIEINSSHLNLISLVVIFTPHLMIGQFTRPQKNKQIHLADKNLVITIYVCHSLVVLISSLITPQVFPSPHFITLSRPSNLPLNIPQDLQFSTQHFSTLPNHLNMLRLSSKVTQPHLEDKAPFVIHTDYSPCFPPCKLPRLN